MRTILLFLGLSSVLPAQAQVDAIHLLEATGRKYQDIGSYQASAVAQRPLDQNLTLEIPMVFGYASASMTPPNWPVPMLPEFMISGAAKITDRQGKPVQLSKSITSPGSSLLTSFEQIAQKVVSAKITGSGTVHSLQCDIVDVQYEDTTRNPKGQPVRYWIEPATGTIWKMQFSEPDGSSTSGELANWSVVWDTWSENQAPPPWQLELGKSMVGAERPALVGHLAPEVEGQSLSGEAFKLSKLEGNVVVLDFWATWCGPCAEEMASLEELKKSLIGKHVEIWSITEDKPAALKRWMTERKRNLATVIAPKDTAFKTYGIDQLPQLVMIDRSGNVAHHWAGMKSEADLRDAIEDLLAE
jgi:cytochrome c biogenesis protein CcmG/thiol:disulfide interchange protein DsbE